MEPIDYVRALIRRWPLIAVGALLGATFAFFSTGANPEPVRSEFRATHTLLTTLQQISTNSLVGTVTFAQVPVFATTGEVPRLAAEELGYSGAPAALAAQVTVESDPSTGTIRFSTTQEDSTDAVRIADAFADETVAYLSTRQEELRQQNQASALETVEGLDAEIRELDAELQGQVDPETGQAAPGTELLRARRDAAVREYSVAYESLRSLSDTEETALNITTLERAQPVPVNQGGFTPPQSRATRVPIAALVGALLGAALALLVERLDSRLRDRRRAEEAFGASVVAEIPSLSRKQRAARLVVGPEFHDAASEAFRSLRTSVTFMAAGGQPQSQGDRVGVIMVTSPSPAEGKTTTAVNLAAAFAETGRSVIVVNSDFRRPIATTVLVGERPPLPAGLAGIERLDPAEFLAETRIPGVQLLDLSSLGGTPGDLTRATLKLMSALSTMVDVVIVDTPPLAVTTEALEFVPVSQVVILVGRLGHTATTAAERGGELIRFGGADHLAIALTDTGSGRRKQSRYYDYYQESSGAKAKSGRRRRSSETSSGPQSALARHPMPAEGSAPADVDVDAVPDSNNELPYDYAPADAEKS